MINTKMKSVLLMASAVTLIAAIQWKVSPQESATLPVAEGEHSYESHKAHSHSKPARQLCRNKGIAARGLVTLKSDRDIMAAGDRANIRFTIDAYSNLEDAQLTVGMGPGLQLVSGNSAESFVHTTGARIVRDVTVLKTETVPSSVFVTVRGRRPETGGWASFSSHVSLDVPEADRKAVPTFAGANGRVLAGDR